MSNNDKKTLLDTFKSYPFRFLELPILSKDNSLYHSSKIENSDVEEIITQLIKQMKIQNNY